MSMKEIFSIFGMIGANNDEAIEKIDETVASAKQADIALSKSFTNGLSGVTQGLAKISDGASRMAVSVGTSISDIGSKLTNGITKPALVAATAVGGIIIGKGWGRLVQIDNARAKLTALGHDASNVEKIMNNAHAAVKGTAFGLDEAATAAASALASGVKQGQELESYLTLVGDTAAMAGSQFSDMGSIFNKIMANGRVQTEELNQLTDRGVDIIGALGDQFGINATEVRQWASEGKISAQDFLTAIEDSVGGAAAIIGAESFSAALTNIGASFSRIGQGFLDGAEGGKGFFSQMKPLLGELNEYLGTIEDKAGQLGDKVGQAFAKGVESLREFMDTWKAMPKETKSMITSMAGTLGILAVAGGPILSVLGNILKVSGQLASPLANLATTLVSLGAGFTNAQTGAITLAGVFTQLGGAIAGLTSIGMVGVGIGGLIAGLGLIQKHFGSEINKLLEMATTKGPQIISNLANGISSQMPELMSLGSELLINLMNAITSNLGAISEGARSIIESIGQGFSENGDALMQAVTGLIAGLISTIAVVAPSLFTLGVQLLTGILTGFVDNIDIVIEAVLTFIQNMGLAIIEALPQLVLAGFQLLQGLIRGIVENIPMIISVVGTLITTFLATVLTQLPQLIMAGLEMLQSVRNGIIENLPAIVGAIVEVVLSILATIGANLPKIIESGISILLGLISGIIETIPKLLAVVPDIFTRVVDAFKSQDWLSIGSNIIDGIVKGLKNMAGTLIDTARSIASDAWGAIKDFFDIRSPSKLTEKEGGVMIIRGIMEGFQRMKRPLIGAAKGVANVMNPMTHFNNDDLYASANPQLAGYTFKGNSNQEGNLMYLFNTLVDQNEDIIEVLYNIFDKNSDMYIDGKEVSKSIYPTLNSHASTLETLKLRTQGRH